MVIISLELTRVNPDRNIFSRNVELTSTFFTLQRFGPSLSPNFKVIDLVVLLGLNVFNSDTLVNFAAVERRKLLI